KLDHQTFGIAGRLYRLNEGAHEIEIAGLPRSDVNTDAGAAAERIIEPLDGADSFGQHEIGDGIDQTKLNAKADEIAGRVNFAVIVAPTHQCFETDDLLSEDVDLGLERTAEFAVADGKAQALLDLHARGELLRHGGVEIDHITFGLVLGAIHGVVGIAPQR